jgi:predicted ATPase with chaperone activity
MREGDRVTPHDEEHLGDLLSALPPAPEAWVRTAKELPLARRRLDEIIERAEVDEDYRRRVVTDPESALEAADVVAHARTIQIIRRRLDGKKEEQR